MASKELEVRQISYSINYEIKNLHFDEYILILHGWGASKDIMIKAFGTKFKELKQVYLDLPGFGASSIDKPLRTVDYADIVQAFIDSLGKKPTAIMGHSFGGKVATLLKPPTLILLSSAGIITDKPFIVRAKIKTYKVLKLLGLGKFYSLFATKDVAGMSKTMYETLKNVVDEDFSVHFSALSSKTLIFWGKDDRATPLKSGEQIHKIIKNSQFFPLDGDHFFFLLHSDFIAKLAQDAILESINERGVGKFESGSGYKKNSESVHNIHKDEFLNNTRQSAKFDVRYRANLCQTHKISDRKADVINLNY